MVARCCGTSSSLFQGGCNLCSLHRINAQTRGVSSCSLGLLQRPWREAAPQLAFGTSQSAGSSSSRSSTTLAKPKSKIDVLPNMQLFGVERWHEGRRRSPQKKVDVLRRSLDVRTRMGTTRSYSSAASESHNAVVQLSKQRLDSLIEAEIVHFATALPSHPITLQQMLAREDADSLREFLLQEVPIRYAKRLQLIQSLDGWNKHPHMRVIRSRYYEAFRKLRMLDPNDAQVFRKTLTDIKHQHSNMLMHAIRGVQGMEAAGFLDGKRVDAFLDDFLTARIGTDILTSQYLALTRPENLGGPMTVIDPQCDPVKWVRVAAADAVRLCKYHYSCAPPVEVVDISQVRFPFIPQYLNYIMFEIIKNSLRAVTEKYETTELSEHPIRVTVCGDDTTVVIRVSDAGGGIPLDVLPRVWSYLYTTAKPLAEDENTYDSEQSEDEVEYAPMAGFGCGLPLSRTYASYCGGQLELHSTPHYGADAYLYLNRDGNAEEVVDFALPAMS